jgi:hypothetical protein
MTNAQILSGDRLITYKRVRVSDIKSKTVFIVIASVVLAVCMSTDNQVLFWQIFPLLSVLVSVSLLTYRLVRGETLPQLKYMEQQDAKKLTADAKAEIDRVLSSQSQK